MMKRTNSFTMIEIVLAMGVIVIGVISVLGLFPVGLNASRDAIAESYACESADQFLHFYEYQMRRGDWDIASLPDSRPNNSIMEAATMGNAVEEDITGGTVYETSEAGVYWLRIATDVDGEEVVDFDGMMTLWKDDVTVGGQTVDTDIARALMMEISWPAHTSTYTDRRTATYRYELFNR